MSSRGSSFSPPDQTRGLEIDTAATPTGNDGHDHHTHSDDDDDRRAPSEKGDGVGGLRQTAEYRAAWDLELWKAIQAERFRRQLEQQRTRALRDLAHGVKLKEEEAIVEIERRSEGLRAREAYLEKETATLRRRQSCLQESEKTLRRMRQQLLDAQRRLEEENSALRRRAHEVSNETDLLQERLKVAESQARRAEERQRQTQSEYLRLYVDFHRLCLEKRAPTDVENGEKAPHTRSLDLERVERLQEKHVEEQQLLRERLEHHHRIELAKVAQRCRVLEVHNEQLVAALARRREQLRMRRWRSGRCDDVDVTSRSRAVTKRESVGTPASPVEAGLRQELERLVQERTILLEGSAGAIDAQDSVVQRLDARLAEIGRRLDKFQEYKESRIDKMAG